jgi:hypothetical protein
MSLSRFSWTYWKNIKRKSLIHSLGLDLFRNAPADIADSLLLDWFHNTQTDVADYFSLDLLPE